MASIRRISKATPIDDACAVMTEDGAMIVTGLLGDSAFRDLQREIGPEFARAEFCRGLFYGEKTKRIHGVVAKSKTCREMVMLPEIVAVVSRLLLGSCERIQLNLTQGIEIWPGEQAQVPHRDDALFPFEKKPFEFMVNALWACSEFTKDNGATVVVPGSHLWDDKQRLPVPEEITQAEMVPGEVLVYVGSLVHGGGANRTTAPRTGLTVSYCLGWLRQAENQYLVAPPEVAMTYDKALQDMLGYSVHRPNLGIYEGVEPNVLLGERPEKFVTRDWLMPDQEKLVSRYYAGQNPVVG